MHPKTEVRLHLIRHSESVMNQYPNLVGGRSPETPLSGWGESLCNDLSDFILYNIKNIDLAYSSPIPRAIATAERSLDEDDFKKLILDERLVEYSGGEWEGKDRSKVQTPEVLHQMALMGIDFRPPGGESQRDVILRVAAWLQEAILGNDEILQSGRCFNIVVFSHGLAIKCLLHHILGFDSHLIWRTEIDNCGVSKLVFNSRGWWPKYINRVAHDQT